MVKTVIACVIALPCILAPQSAEAGKGPFKKGFFNNLGEKIKEAQDPMSGKYKQDRIDLDAEIEAMKTQGPTQTGEELQSLDAKYGDMGSSCTVLYDDDAQQDCYERVAAAWGPLFLSSIEQRLDEGDGLLAHWGVRRYAHHVTSYRFGETKPAWPVDLARRAADARVQEANALFDRYGRYAKSHEWGCVPSAKPLPARGDARIDVTYHVKRDSTVYVRCFLPTTVGTYIQGKDISDFGAQGTITDYPSFDEHTYNYKINYSDHLKRDWVDFEIEVDRGAPKADFGTATTQFYVYWISGYQDVWNDSRNAWVQQAIGANHTETVSVTYTP